MRKWILRFHMYTGLGLFGFLIVFAVSALCFNHKPGFMESGKSDLTWNQPITTPRQGFTEIKWLPDAGFEIATPSCMAALAH